MNCLSRFFLLLLFLLTLVPVQAEPITLDKNLEMELLRPGVWLHRSWMEVEGFGRVECNGLVFVNEGEALVIDTPGSLELTEALLKWLESQQLQVKGLVVGHTHADAMGGLEVFQARGLPSYSSTLSRDLARRQSKPVPAIGFDSQIRIGLGKAEVVAAYLGAGHTKDNIVTYLPQEKVLFGGCLVKALEAGKGNLEDADLSAWSSTIQKVAETFPEAELIVPGHGKVGDRWLLEYTFEMFAE